MLAALAVLHGIWQWARSRKRVFLLDFACYKPPDDLKVSYEGFITGLANAKVSTQLLPSSVSVEDIQQMTCPYPGRHVCKSLHHRGCATKVPSLRQMQ